MAKKKEEPDYITHVSKVKIGGYKSIESVSIEFEKGLNILIGQNGTGKSNFFESFHLFHFINNSDLKLPEAWDIIVCTSNEKYFRWQKLKQKIKETPFNKIFTNQQISINNEVVKDLVKANKNIDFKNLTLLDLKYLPWFYKTNFYEIFHNFNIDFKSFPFNIISYDLPYYRDLNAIAIPCQISFNKSGELIDFPMSFRIIEEKLREIVSDIDVTLLKKPIKFEPKRSLIENNILKRLIFNESIVRIIAKVTPIEDFRFSKNINFYKNDKKSSIENIILEFKVHGEWMPWSWLSDGTKRLFYIVSEVASQEHGIILIEEPELGIHPHQFHLLMNFLKEESKDKQIIISTHSPQALDYLNADELSHIIIADYDDKKGTQLRKLKAKQIKDALKYSKEIGNISDYWIHMDLEGTKE